MEYVGACCGVAAIIFLIIFLYNLSTRRGDWKVAFVAGASFLLTMCLAVDIGIWYNKINTAGVSESTVDLVVEHTSVIRKKLVL